MHLNPSGRGGWVSSNSLGQICFQVNPVATIFFGQLKVCVNGAKCKIRRRLEYSKFSKDKYHGNNLGRDS